MAGIERNFEELRADRADRAAELDAHKVEHAALMARLARNDLRQQQALEEMRRQTREIIREVSRLDAERKVEAARNRAEDARNEAEHIKFMAALKAIQDKASSS